MSPSDPTAANDDSRLDRLLTPEEQARFVGIASTLTFPDRGQPVYHEGQLADALYFIERGMVETSCQAEEGERQIVAFLHPGDLFGLFENQRYVNTARTLAPALLLRLPLDALHRLLAEDAQLQLHFLAKAAHDLRRSQRQLIVLGRQDVRRRVASFLLELVQHHDTYDPDTGIVALPMSRTDIADYLATTAESVVRALTLLEKEGLIQRLSPKAIRLLELKRLMRLAVF